jgi:hypothetical protein
MPASPVSKSVYALVTDRDITLPRFQRAKAWNDRQRFELCLSLFRELPFGAVVVRRETEPNDPTKVKEIRLLDGRQRREAFREMLFPVNIYLWASRELRLHPTDSLLAVTNKFWDYVA